MRGVRKMRYEERRQSGRRTAALRASRPSIPHAPFASFCSTSMPRSDPAILGGVGNAEVRVAVAEDAAGNHQQLVLDGSTDKLGGAAPRRFGKCIEAPPGMVSSYVS